MKNLFIMLHCVFSRFPDVPGHFHNLRGEYLFVKGVSG